MSTFIISIPYHTGGPSWCNRARRNTKGTDWKGKKKILVHKQNGSVCREYPQNYEDDLKSYK